MLYNKNNRNMGGCAVSCIKCGRDLRDEQVFCRECQDNMEHYPVKPGTPVQLPARTPQPNTKAKPIRIKKTLPVEVRLRKQRVTIRLLILALVAVLLAFMATAVLSLHLLDQRDRQSQAGQNYTVSSES